MSKSILIFLPNSLERRKSGFLIGCHDIFDDSEAYYITSDIVSNNSFGCIGFVGKSWKNCKYKNKPLFLDSASGKISLLSDNCDRSIVQIIYDYKGFKNSDVVYGESENYGKHFRKLTNKLRERTSLMSENGRKSFFETVVLFTVFLLELVIKAFNNFKAIVSYSTTFLQFEETIILLKWFLGKLLSDKKFTPKIGNAFLAKVIDVAIGIILLNWFLKRECDIVNAIQFVIEDIISNLKGLLLYLMGSPIGLKLNHSFNKFLGQFFFYHISLWRIFLRGVQPLFVTYFRYLVLPGALGFSFQIAMLSDIISITTFHVYCIYVYAARLFSLQLRGLTSLWRLFMGRKYNPLRERVDSCYYSQNQLFIGTLGFTILLFLLPTTTMYYTVFSIFRLVILAVDGLLLRLRFILNTIPLYVVLLWIFGSSSVAGKNTLPIETLGSFKIPRLLGQCCSFLGTVYMRWKNGDEHGTVEIEAKLKKLPITCCIEKFVPDTINPIKSNTLGYLFHSSVTGTLI